MLEVCHTVKITESENPLLFKLIEKTDKKSAFLYVETALKYYDSCTHKLELVSNTNIQKDFSSQPDENTSILKAILKELKSLNSKNIQISEQSSTKSSMDDLKSTEGIDFSKSILMFDDD